MPRDIVYLSGRMTGLPDLGRAAFLAAERRISATGAIVLNPAVLPIGLPADSYMPICLKMLDVANAICMLDGWEASPGARLEREYAFYQHKTFYCDARPCGEEAGTAEEVNDHV